MNTYALYKLILKSNDNKINMSRNPNFMTLHIYLKFCNNSYNLYNYASYKNMMALVAFCFKDLYALFFKKTI